MIGKTILHYKITEKRGSPREISVIKFHFKCQFNVTISQGTPNEILGITLLIPELTYIISRGKGGMI